MLKFLLLDMGSPEAVCESADENEVMRERQLHKINHEIDSIKQIIMKSVGAERIVARKTAKEKLISKDETDKLIEDIDEFLQSEFEKLKVEDVPT